MSAAKTDSLPDSSKRDFLYIATGTVGAVGAASFVWPLVDQMNPDASTRALASIEVDVSSVEKGQSLTVKWRGKPVFIRYRTDKEVEEALATPMADLKDPDARNKNLDVGAVKEASDLNRSAGEGRENWIIMIGICTHLGCVPKGQVVGDATGDYGGWFCPCHGSHYDTAGRIRKGPAPENLAIPLYEFVSDTNLKIG
ncbi:MAG: ubiquinol-cytochrome c reductase iron-sulfur subunit [Rhizobiaceae bacterium]|nr:ubiquinol-cytochrome c reductase iron-sulfur subunit [Rhizobiaceae bacterium]